MIQVGTDDGPGTVCGNISIHEINRGPVIEKTCNMMGRYISVELQSNEEPLTLCEVKAFFGTCKENYGKCPVILGRIGPAYIDVYTKSPVRQECICNEHRITRTHLADNNMT